MHLNGIHNSSTEPIVPVPGVSDMHLNGIHNSTQNKMMKLINIHKV
mgnify:FL=1